MFAKTAAPRQPPHSGQEPRTGVGSLGQGQGLSRHSQGERRVPRARGRAPAPGTQHPGKVPGSAASRGGSASAGTPLLRLPQSPAHPGACPQFPAGPRRVPCPNACSDDRGCPPEQKCCFTGCGLGCVTPLGSGSSDFAPPGEVDWSLSQAEETHRGDKGGVLGVPGPLCTMGGSEPF